jgi:hypothetical protein
MVHHNTEVVKVGDILKAIPTETEGSMIMHPEGDTPILIDEEDSKPQNQAQSQKGGHGGSNRSTPTTTYNANIGH